MSITMSAVPDRSRQQRTDALAEANRIRTYRAQLKRAIAAGAEFAQDRIADPEPDVATMKVYELLMAMPRVGRAKANGVLRRCNVSPSKTLGGLSDRQRKELVYALWAYPATRRVAA